MADPPPPGIDVDHVGRSPLRLLRSSMNKHKPKYMNIVPPGLFRGAVAPPYTWDARERDDWAYERPRRFGESTGDEDVLGKAPTPAPQVDPRKARILAIKTQLNQLRLELKQLLARQHMLVQAGKTHLAAKTPVGVESLDRSALRLFEDDAEDILGPKVHKPIKRPGFVGPAETHKGMTWINRLDRRSKTSAPLGLSRSPLTSISRQRRQERKQTLAGHIGPQRTVGAAPPQSPEIIQIHNQIQQKRAQIANLVNELKQLRMQSAAAHESVGLIPNRRSGLRLLLK